MSIFSSFVLMWEAFEEVKKHGFSTQEIIDESKKTLLERLQMKNQMESLQSQYNSIVNQNYQLETNIKNKNRQIEELNNNIEQKDITIHDLETRLASIAAEKQNLIQQLEELRTFIPNNTNAQNNINNPITILDSQTMQRYTRVKEIGRSYNSTVFEIYEKKIFALKELIRVNHQNMQQFLNEYEILNSLKHPNILKTYGIFLNGEGNPPSIILEHCADNMFDAIKDKKITKEKITFSIYQIAEGMKYIHSKNIIHKDLKPSNILICEDGTIKISDFGISKLVEEGLDTFTGGNGTIPFMAPELIRNEEYNEKVDVYAFGVLIYFMINDGNFPQISIFDIGNGRKAEIPDTFNDLAKELINSCWESHPNDRPGFDEICQKLEENNYKILDLNEEENHQVQLLINTHKYKIPNY